MRGALVAKHAYMSDHLKLFKNRYEILPRTLGDGAEATAHLALDVATKKQLVCKLINVGQQAHRNPKKALQSALQEADVLRQLHHVRHIFPILLRC